ncbi:hypothetical protein BGZ60DRAFT_525960 [Tricladium varicosporioides]|nr:hypothetical protein BGZ60DRAFT_525960 [Hymenoscyphus varicosporioides]
MTRVSGLEAMVEEPLGHKENSMLSETTPSTKKVIQHLGHSVTKHGEALMKTTPVVIDLLLNQPIGSGSKSLDPTSTTPTLTTIPTELILPIFNHLDAASSVSFSLTCKRLYAVHLSTNPAKSNLYSHLSMVNHGYCLITLLRGWFPTDMEYCYSLGVFVWHERHAERLRVKDLDEEQSEAVLFVNGKSRKYWPWIRRSIA